MIKSYRNSVLKLSMQGKSILGTVNYKRENTHDMWERCKCYNLTQTILLVGKVMTLVQVVTSAVTADALSTNLALEFLRKTLSTIRCFTYTQM
jgi:hypothetical protein